MARFAVIPTASSELDIVHRAALSLVTTTWSLHRMTRIANVMTLVVALIHFYILVLEMFLWTKPRGRRIFGMTEDFAQASRVLAANQGLYNGFLAVGLVWSVIIGGNGAAIRVFLLGCIVVAGVYGAMTMGNKRVVFIQSLPAVVAIVLTSLAYPQ